MSQACCKPSFVLNLGLSLSYRSFLISCSKSGRVKRSEGAKYFQDSDVKVLGLSPNGENTWKIEFAVLFPPVDGKAPQPSPPDELVRMVHENKKTIEKAVGGSIEGITIGKLISFSGNIIIRKVNRSVDRQIDR